MKFAKSTEHSCRMIRRAPCRRTFRTRSHRIPAIPTPPSSIESPPPSPRSISSLSTLIIDPQSPRSVTPVSTLDDEPSSYPFQRSPPTLVDYFNSLSPDHQLQLIHELQGEMLELFNSENLWFFRTHTHSHTHTQTIVCIFFDCYLL